MRQFLDHAPRPNLADFKSGDLIFTSNRNGIMGRFIPFFETSPGEEDTIVSHMGIVISGGGVNSAWVGEPTFSIRPRVVKHPFTELTGDVWVMRLETLTDAQRYLIGSTADDRVGEDYAWWRLGGYAIDNLISRGLGIFGIKKEVRLVSKLNFLSNVSVCSNYATSCLDKFYDWKVDTKELTPDEAWDICKADKNFKLVFYPHWYKE